MSYQVIARRWRPQNFNEVVFQDHVLKTIRNSISSGRVSHAYIFTGPRGVGKTTVARILAKSLNCLEGPTPDPCGVCENCVEIKNGTSFDVYEIDGASNTSVDNIRDLREKVNFAPVKSKYKIYIIDEVHMLSTGAFNALLKTLEEPPAHVVFIFATTEIHKVPDTILSRCQKYNFKKIPVEAIADHLKKILSSDKVDYEPSAIFPIARASGGSMRDAQSLLEQAISFSDGKITEANALESLGIVPFSSYSRLLSALVSLSKEALMKEIDSIAESGANLQLYLSGFAEVIRCVRLLKSGIYLYNASSFSKEEAEALKKFSDEFSDEELSAFFKILTSTYFEIKGIENERLSIEMGLLDMIELRSRPSIAEIIKKLESSPGVFPTAEKKSVQTANPEVPVRNIPERINPASSQPQKKNDIAADGILNSFFEESRKIKLYLYQKLKAAYNVEVKSSVVVFSKINDGKILDAHDIAFIKDWFAAKSFSVRIAEENEPDDAPLPEEDVHTAVDFGVEEKPHPAVEKVVNFFQGEIVEPQKKNNMNKNIGE
ncbi:MAG TPA: DNA polymerase III subunit gamma/tau [Spirochaetota bacterium]|nr:DNA polymerase III subunit gamma/tau [Spirochaetota bacterium]HQE59480.1 DNA polymerase III subunit gamma/tau [Spirochaetota bacterium]